MKKILSIILLVFSSYLLKAQTYPIPQNLGGPTTLVQNPNYGGFKGGLIPYTFADTTAANTALTYGKNYGGFFIYTSDVQGIWFRDLTNTKWVQLLPAGSPSANNAWLLLGNTSTVTDPDSLVLGTLNYRNFYFITNDLKRFGIHRDGIQANTADVVNLGYNTVTGMLSYASTTGTIPTWQQTLTAGSTLTGANTIAGGGFDFTWNNLGILTFNGNVSLPATSSSSTGVILKGSNRFIHDFKLAGTDGENLFIGSLSGNFAMTGSSGIQGSYNLGVGGATLNANTTGFRNTAIGIYALQQNTTGFSNTAVGQASLFATSTGFNNTAIGTRALTFNVNGTSNSAHGVDALFANTSGSFNTAICIDALYQNTTGSYNVGVGDSTFWIGTIGIKNTGIGSRAGYYIGDTYPNFASVKDSMVTFLGADASRDSSISNTTALKNLTVIGYNAKGLASNQVVLGNDDVTTTLLKGNVGAGTTTPAYKLDVLANTVGSFATNIYNSNADGAGLGVRVNNTVVDRKVFDVLSGSGGTNSLFHITADGKTNIPSLTNLSTQNRLVGQLSSNGQLGNITLTSPLLLSSGALSCPTCVTSAAALTANSLMIGAGSQGSSTTTASAQFATLGGGATAAELRFLEPSGSGTNYAGFKAPALAGNTIYDLPNAFPAGNDYLLKSSTAGVMAWQDPTSLAYWKLTGTNTLTGDVTNSGFNVGMGITPTSQLHTTSFAAGYTLVGDNTYSILATDYTLSVNNSSSNWTIDLPDPSTCAGRIYIIKRFDDASTGTITIDSNGGNVQDIGDGTFNATYLLGAWGTYESSVMFQSNGTDWEAIK